MLAHPAQQRVAPRRERPTTDPRWRKVERWIANASPLVMPVLLNQHDFADIGTALSEHGEVGVSRMTARRRADLSSVSRRWPARSGSLRPAHHEVKADSEAEGGSVRTLILHVADALSLHLRRLAGGTYYTGDSNIIDRLVPGRLATAGSRRRDLRSGRARQVDEPPPAAHHDPAARPGRGRRGGDRRRPRGAGAPALRRRPAPQPVPARRSDRLQSTAPTSTCP